MNESRAIVNPMHLYQYFEHERGPFLTLSDLSFEYATNMQNSLKENGNLLEKRDFDGNYLTFRRKVEADVRAAFIYKGGKPVRTAPQYFSLGENHIIAAEWFKCTDWVSIPIDEFDLETVSFTYGDSFIVNHPEHSNKADHRINVCTYAEILAKIEENGWPQAFIKEDSPFWMPRYIEAQVWSDEPINKYRQQ